MPDIQAAGAAGPGVGEMGVVNDHRRYYLNNRDAEDRQEICRNWVAHPTGVGCEATRNSTHLLRVSKLTLDLGGISCAFGTHPHWGGPPGEDF